jgi:Rrf2 family transcriptional regulator, cysteine metabolism repressor
VIRLSTKAQYAARLMVELARERKNQTLRQKDLARRSGITTDYVAQILIVLRHAGLVRSHRGMQGGFAIARDPGTISVADVVEAVDGPILLAPGLGEEHEGLPASDCATRGIWEHASRILRETLAGVTLETLAEEADMRQNRKAITFEI